jgi:hypothetical protein
MDNLNEIKTSGKIKANRAVIRLYPNHVTDYLQITVIENTALITISD